MKQIQKLGYIVLGAVLAVIIGTAAPVLAESVQKQLTAHYNNIKIYIDGELITPKDANGNIVEPFISDGTTYLPVRAVGEAFGKTVEWDGITQSIYVGLKPGAIAYLPDICPAYQHSNYEEYSALASGGSKSIIMANEKYTDALYWNNDGGYALYNFNGQYTSFSGKIGKIDGKNEYNKVEFYCDGVLKKTIFMPKDAYPQDFTLDLHGVLQLKIVGAKYTEDERKSYDMVWNDGTGVMIRNIVIADPVLK